MSWKCAYTCKACALGLETGQRIDAGYTVVRICHIDNFIEVQTDEGFPTRRAVQGSKLSFEGTGITIDWGPS